MKRNQRKSLPTPVRVGAGLVGAGLLAVGLNYAIEGNGGQRPTDPTLPASTEHALGQVIDPALQSVGEKVLSFAASHPDTCTRTHLMAGKILEVTCEGPKSGSVVKVYMETKGTNTSAPGKTILVSTNYQNVSPHQEKGSGFTLASPTGTKDVNDQTATYTGNGVSGWQAQEFGTVKGTGNYGSTSFTYDTTDSKYFTTDYYPGGDPVSTAQTIVSDVPGDLDTILTDIASQ